MKDTLFYVFISFILLVAAIGLIILCVYAPILAMIIAIVIYFIINIFY